MTRVEPSPVCRLGSIEEEFDINEDTLLGEGGFAKVVIGKRKSDNIDMAVKVMERSELKGKKYLMMCQEREILRFAKHPNIVRLHKCVETEERIYMIMEKMDTDLYEYLKAKNTISENDTSKIIGSILKGVCYLHDNCIVHRDVKPENILLKQSPDSGVLEVRIADFGIAKVIESHNVNATPIGTSYYMAPEVIRGIQLLGLNPRKTTRDELKYLDIWSTGVVTYICISAAPPFYGTLRTSDDREFLLNKINSGILFPESKWGGVSDSAKDFIATMLSVDTSKRATARSALQHPFILDVQSSAVRSPASPRGKLTRKEVKAHLESLIRTCDASLDPSGQDPASPRGGETQSLAPPTTATTTATTTELPKPSNPMKLRRSRKPM
eukprot:TRINITY_DN5105_c0_g1_i1.p1 TRINITY_DN5105_c0_g1~~TRINITY_DN5105_c0_g1_i1.p1  ORF type:complete len:404 (+),score=78.46 TRINITY_DN5105_c0_g1_i1:66-1214(+)